MFYFCSICCVFGMSPQASFEQRLGHTSHVQTHTTCRLSSEMYPLVSLLCTSVPAVSSLATMRERVVFVWSRFLAHVKGTHKKGG